jgi:hypothetical protein
MKGTPYKYDPNMFGKKDDSTPFVREEHEAKLYEIMKKENVYLTFLKFMKRGAKNQAQKIVEDIYDRHGQNLDGKLDTKFSEKQVRKELGNTK